MFRQTVAAATLLLLGVSVGHAQQEPPDVQTTTVEIFGTVVGGEFAGTEGTGSVTFSQPEFFRPPIDFPQNEVFFPLPDILIDIDDEFPFPGEFPGFGPLDLLVLDLDFTIFGQTFTEENDVDFPGAPFLFIDFETGELTAIDFVVSEDGDTLNTTEIVQEGVFELSFGLPFFEIDFPIDGEFPPGFFPGDEQFAVANADGPSITVDVVVNGVTEVPLPATAWLLLAGLGGLGALRARRKA
ncbi:MAG: VPLPA-CTERM sorting domain-containing protein [Pseudomonadota bacterium]